MSSLNCAIINCCKITRTGLVCSKGDVADLATNNAPLAYFNAANEDGDSNTSVLLNKGKTSSSHIPQKYSYQCTECKFRKRKLAAVKNHIRKFHADSPKLPIRKDCPRGQLKEHVDKNTRMVKNRKCYVCGKAFSAKHHFELHMRLHNKRNHVRNLMFTSRNLKRTHAD